MHMHLFSGSWMFNIVTRVFFRIADPIFFSVCRFSSVTPLLTLHLHDSRI